MPILHTLVHDARLLAARADAKKAQSGQDGGEEDEKQRDVAQRLERVFSVCYNDRTLGPEGKKSGCLYVVNTLFNIYFRLNQLRKCNNLINSVNKKTFPSLDQLPKRDTVTYKYYTGRLSMFQDKFKQAETELDFALAHCHRDSALNKRRILEYLVPVKLLTGQIPTAALLEKYQLPHYMLLSSAVRSGNLKQFNEALAQHQDLFIRAGVYLVLEKVKVLVHRTLLKKIYLLGDGFHKLRLAQFARALSWQDVRMEPAEIECIVANLIYKGYIKGYISHNMGMLVVRKNDNPARPTPPFPPVRSLLG